MNTTHFIPLDPPGTWLAKEALKEFTKDLEVRSFIDVGCGNGTFSKIFCERGARGLGVDFSKEACSTAKEKCSRFIKSGKYNLRCADILTSHIDEKADLAFSMMVMEHIEDDQAFLNKLKSLVHRGGTMMVAVPARMDKWGIEDETVGHHRRYSRETLRKVFQDCGLTCDKMWSVGVPIINMLLGVSNLTIRMANAKNQREHCSMEEQTKSSGVERIPYKTVFPPSYKLLLNRYALFPFFIFQRFFYNSRCGLVLFARATVK